MLDVFFFLLLFRWGYVLGVYIQFCFNLFLLVCGLRESSSLYILSFLLIQMFWLTIEKVDQLGRVH